jgi:hypothetical protein
MKPFSFGTSQRALSPMDDVIEEKKEAPKKDNWSRRLAQ